MPGKPVPYQPYESFMRVATACPEVAVGDVTANVRRISRLYDTCVKDQVSLVVFPELSLIGYTIGDLVQQKIVLERVEQGLLELASRTKTTETAMVVGLPVAVGNNLFNCAALIAKGKIQGVVPKTYLPGQSEFYEPRWFQPWRHNNTEILIGNQSTIFGTDLLFKVGSAKVGIEVCEDLWVPNQPSIRLAAAGALIIANPSASPEQVTKDTYRRQLVTMQSGRLSSAYIYAGCDSSESTMDIVMGGHQLIAENGTILAERRPLTLGKSLSMADIDLDRLRYDRRKDNNFPTEVLPTIDCGITPQQTNLLRQVDSRPFIPKGPDASNNLQHVFDIQAQGLATRMRNTGITKLVLGLSGGLDSTLVLLVALNALERLGIKPDSSLQTITMPGKASSDRTQINAVQIAKELRLVNEVIPIADLAGSQLHALSHDGITQDVTYENVQARLRTSILFNRANQVHGFVLGTGDLSEIALGWCTYNGDHMSHYNVNASIPKSLVRHLIEYAATKQPAQVQTILRSILDTPISPELTKNGESEISQQTEDLIGPYVLHDFFLYHFMRSGDTPAKIAFLARQAFHDAYSQADIDHWLRVFIDRFMHNQWKRSVATDGPKVGSVSLSPRGDLRMPSDINGRMWSNKTK